MHVTTLFINFDVGLVTTFISGAINYQSGLPMFLVSKYPNNNDLQKGFDYA